MTARAAWLPCLLAASLLFSGAAPSRAEEVPEQSVAVFTVDGKVALASLMALSDAHLLKLADSMRMLAATPEAQSGDWKKIRAPLARAAAQNVSALNWFALPDGTYWSVQDGKAAGNLARRAYFPTVLAGKAVIGDLVVSTATGRAAAIVAVPVVRRGKGVVGVLGASVYLDQLSARLEKEMRLDGTMIFFSFDSQPLVALDWDPSLIFLNPTKLGQEDVGRAFAEMLAKEQGVSRYVFRGALRTVLFRKSPVTGWWYAFGLIPGGRETGQSAHQ